MQRVNLSHAALSYNITKVSGMNLQSKSSFAYKALGSQAPMCDCNQILHDLLSIQIRILSPLCIRTLENTSCDSNIEPLWITRVLFILSKNKIKKIVCQNANLIHSKKLTNNASKVHSPLYRREKIKDTASANLFYNFHTPRTVS